MNCFSQLFLRLSLPCWIALSAYLSVCMPSAVSAELKLQNNSEEAHLCVEIKLFGGRLVLNSDGTVSFFQDGEELGSFGTTWESWTEEDYRGIDISFPGYSIPLFVDIPPIQSSIGLGPDGKGSLEIGFTADGEEWMLRGPLPGTLELYRDGSLVQHVEDVPENIQELLNLLKKGLGGLKLGLSSCSATPL